MAFRLRPIEGRDVTIVMSTRRSWKLPATCITITTCLGVEACPRARVPARRCPLASLCPNFELGSRPAYLSVHGGDGAQAQVANGGAFHMVDRWTAEVVSALNAHRFAASAQGPVVSRWLYSDEPSTAVQRHRHLGASRRISGTRAVCFVGLDSQSVRCASFERPQHAELWVRADGAQVDLHRRMHGTTSRRGNALGRRSPTRARSSTSGMSRWTSRRDDAVAACRASPRCERHLVRKLDGPRACPAQIDVRDVATHGRGCTFPANRAHRRVEVERVPARDLALELGLHLLAGVHDDPDGSRTGRSGTSALFDLPARRLPARKRRS